MRGWEPRASGAEERRSRREGAAGRAKCPERRRKTDAPTVGDRLRRGHQREGVAGRVRKANRGRGGTTAARKREKRTARDSGPVGAAGLGAGPPNRGIPAPRAPREPGPPGRPARAPTPLGRVSLPSALSLELRLFPPGRAGPDPRAGGASGARLIPAGPASWVPSQLPHPPS